MHTHIWEKSSYCQEGDACVHISAVPETIHITETADPTQAVLDASPSAFGALLRALREKGSSADVRQSY
ncbi:DUF397 domain-containing protein [Streptomyces capitiformicae]|uniref:DUF397 domain-containing protein n=1 Tax=Streptomyces capitiformicae TaxID=2014920 RepID=A0A919L345_9ACTN|nr:DUF397 domain-containing protein [Streptomyces capitiformicae]GHH82152.1 hypothetical protein GCM10017771_05570 [Streptomyces capitiformicae]